MSRYLKVVIFLSMLLLSAAPVRAAVEYIVTDMGDFSPKAINNRGEVAGFISINSQVMHAAIYSNGTLKDLETLGGTYSTATSINDIGELVGYSMMSDGSYHAFLYRNGSINDLGNFGGLSGRADGINNIGQIAASYVTADGFTNSILYDHGSITELGHLGGNSTISQGINSLGEIVGHEKMNDGIDHAFVYRQEALTDIGTLGGNSYAWAINDAGKIAGESWTSIDLSYHVFIYEDGIISDISDPYYGTHATDINNNGEIVGFGFPINDAFIYKNEQMSNLNNLIDPALGITLTGAYGINDYGQIIALGYNIEMNGSAYLLTPIPEPSSMILLYIGLAIIIMFIWNRKHTS
ncbi:MAG: PEP-CTERM sorting domain-containing protein [Pirellulales bacterium]|nr:PEP-CTERM sorting domain-containing protein [Pirellulales bacterium]